MQKNFLSGTKRVLVGTCVIFTILVLLVYVIGSAVPDFGNAIDLKNILVILFFAFLFSAANRLLALENLPVFLRILLHFTTTAIGFYVVFILIAAKATAPSAIFVMLGFYTLMYALFMGIYQLLFHAIRQKRAEKETGYKSIYK